MWVLEELLFGVGRPIFAAAPRIVREWFGGPKMQARYWQWTLIALVCWTALAALISAAGGALICFLLPLLVLPAWAALAIGWRSEPAGAVLGVAEGVFLFCAVRGIFFFVSGTGVEEFVLSLLVGLPPLAIGIVCLIGGWGSRRAEREETEQVRREDCDAALQYHQTGESLRGANLSRSDLTGIELTNADLRGANLADANLEGAFLVEATLVAANLSSANLSLANLERSDLSNARLYGANLQGATLEDATLDQADIRYANLCETNLRGAILWRANLYQADLRGADLQGADLLQAKLAGATVDDSTAMPEGWEDVVGFKP